MDVKQMLMKLKQYTRKMVSALLVLLCTSVSASAFTVDGITYKVLSADDKTCVVSESAGYPYSGDVVIPESVTSDEGTFTVVGFAESAFSYSDVESVTMPGTIQDIGTNTFFYSKKLKKVVLPETLTEIGDNVFYLCTSLTDINIPATVTRIGDFAFEECTSLTNVTLPEGLTEIGKGAFGYVNLTEIVIPDNVKSIDMMAFFSCKLETITIGKSVEEIWQGAFLSVESSPKSVYVLNPVPPTFRGVNVFGRYDDATTLYVPAGSLEAYKASDWSQYFTNIVEGVPAGISNVTVGTSFDVRTEGGAIVVDGAAGKVAVYDLSGVLLKSVEADGQVVINVPQGGTYIVSAGGSAVKVTL